MADQTMSPPALAGKWTTGEIASDPRVGFLLALGRASHAAGHHSQTLEDLLDRTAARLGVAEAQFFTTPTSIFAAFGAESTQRTYLIRVEPGGPDLGRLVRIEEILEAVLAERLTPLEGAGRLRDVAVSAAPRGPMITTLAFALSSAASAVFLGGGAKEVALAGALGLLTGALALLARHAPALARIFSAAASFVVALLAGVIGALGLGVSVSTATLAGLIVLLPGLMIVSAMRELATGHLSSGTARAAGSFIVLIGIGFGVALGTRAAELLAGPAAHVAALPLPAASVWIAVVVSAVGFTILLHADWRDAPWIVLGAAVALLASRAGGHGLGPELAPFLGSFAVALVAWIYARATRRPAEVVLAPGVLVLVPGSIGFRSITALLDHQVVSGIDAAFTALFTGIALVAGLLIASVVLPGEQGE
jgi:uncharacterized membrane protein YjjP (DUF1212 family)